MIMRLNPKTGKYEEDGVTTPNPMPVSTQPDPARPFDLLNTLKLGADQMKASAPAAVQTPPPVTAAPSVMPDASNNAAPVAPTTVTRPMETSRTETTATARQVQTNQEKKLLEDKSQLEQDAIELQRKQNELNVQKAKEAEAKAAEDAIRLAEKQTATDSVLKQGEEDFNRRMAEYDAQYEKYKNMEIKDYWDDKSTGTKVAAAIAIGLGAFGASMSGRQTNDAANIISAAIDRDFNRQRENILKQKETIGVAKEGMEIARQAKTDRLNDLNLKEAAAKEAVAAKYEQKMRQIGIPEAEIQNDAVLNKLKQDAADRKIAVEQDLRTTVQNSVTKQIAQVQYDVATGQPVGAGSPQATTEAQKKVDDELAKKYAEYVSGGGGGNQGKDIESLKEIKAKIEKSDRGIGGRIWSGIVPKEAEGILDEEQAAIQKHVNNVVATSLKSIFTGAISDSDREFITKNAYDPTLSPQENAKLLQERIDRLEAAQARSREMVKYYEKYGTFAGYEAGGPTQAQPKTKAAAPKVGEVRNGYKFKGGNPNDKASWEKVK